MPTLQFKGKSAIESYHHVVPHHTLEIDKKLSLSKNPGLDGNLIIEGDNLLALKSLLPTHAGRIKCIYIDPPYNTGNESWVYNDNLSQPQFKEWIGKTVGKEGEDATRHDKWCCMMYPRLALLQKLMSPDGVIFVSVDDIELCNLLSILDELFGSVRRLGVLVWRCRNFSDTRSKNGISSDHEYVVAYGNGPDSRLTGKGRSEEKYSNPDKDPRGPWTSCSLLGKATKEQRPNLHYVFENPLTGEVFKPDSLRGWICRPESMRTKILEKRILWPKKPGGRPREKVFLEELQSGVLGFPSIIDGVFTSDGTEELRELFGNPPFTFPKPSLLIRDLIAQVAGKDDIVLDSFSGSGTTGHAAIRLNRQDGGTRKFILVQQPFETLGQAEQEYNICERITRERVKRVVEGYAYTDVKGKKVKVPGLGGEFTYARVGKPLFDEYRDLSKGAPSYEDIACYIWFTETSRTFEPKQLDRKSNRIGVLGDTSYYLLYSAGKGEAPALDKDFLRGLKDKNKRRVVYCEKIWIHRDELREFGDIRPMLVPFNLK